MVRTTTGPAEKSKPDKAPETATHEDKKMEKALDLDDQTWDRIVAMGRNQQIDPSEVIRKAIEQQYGAGQPTGIWHSGREDDPALTAGG